MKFQKKKKESGQPQEQERTQGINADGNALRSAWLLGAALLILPVIGAVAFLSLLREPAQQADILQRLSHSYAVEKAQAIETAVKTLSARVAAAAVSPLAIQAMDDDDPAVLRGLEQRMLNYFPEAASLRLLPLGEMGTAQGTDTLQDLKSHIEVDLVRRAANEDEGPLEAYQLDGQWVISVAQGAVHPEDSLRSIVVMVSLPQEHAATWLNGDSTPGRFALQRRLNKREVTIVSYGVGEAGSEQRAAVGMTPWEIVFQPNASLIEAVALTVRADVDIVLGLALLALAGLIFAGLRSTRALTGELEKIVSGAEQRAPMAVQIPLLVPLARELRKLGQRKRNLGAAQGGGNPAAGASASSVNATNFASIEGPAEEELCAHIFRAYDIRGIADTELDDETVYRIGSAIGTIAGEMQEQTLVLGHDGRTSSNRIVAIVEKALMQSGRDVIKIGLVPTPLLYFATHHIDAHSGIMVTGSHNPADYNGLKIVLNRQTIAEGTMNRIRTLAQEGKFSKGQGRVVQQDVSSDYLGEVMGDIAMAVPLKIVVDAGNGAAGHIAPAVLEELGCEVLPLYCEIDGTFPNHGPDTSDENNLKDLVQEVLANNADFGVAYDGDGDRLAVVTQSGRILRTDVLMMLFARDVVSRNPGADVVYDIKSSRLLAQLITRLGGRPVLWKTGHALMKQKMVETGALLGGEFSGHIFFGERWYGFDDGIYATARLAEILSSHEASLDGLLSDLPTAVSTPEIRIAVDEASKFGIIQRFVAEAEFAEGKSNDLDGLRVDFHDGWGLLRASNTSPALTARFEADDELALQHIMGLFRGQLAAIAPDLNDPF